MANLRDPEYVHLLTGSRDQLPATFAHIDSDGLTSFLTLVRDNRDSQLRAVLRQLLEEPTETPTTASEAKQCPSSELVAPTPEEIAASAHEMQD